MTEPDSIERPEGFEGRAIPSDPGPLPNRPDWLVGAEDVLEERADSPERPRLSASRPPERATEGRESAAEQRPVAWSAAASSVPKLRIVPREPELADEEEPERPYSMEAVPSMDALDDGENAPAPKIAPAIQPLEEPWWLVIGERIATDRRLWLAAGVIAMLAIAAAFVPRGKEPGVALSAIKRHPERFEGRAVTVRGKVGEVFDVGQGYVFHLHQGRDTVVVFSPSRRPKTHDGVVVAGTVTTGYLDGAARVAVFENP